MKNKKKRRPIRFRLASLALIAAASACFHPRPPTVDAIELVESVPVETGLDNADLRNTADVWCEMIRSARETIEMGQFYYAHRPGETLDRVILELAAAARRGVPIRCLADSRMSATYPILLDALRHMPGVSVRLIDFAALAGGTHHAKYIIVDGETVFIGSPNFDWRSLTHIHELGLRIRDRRLAAVYRRIFEMDWRLAGGQSRESVLGELAAKVEPAFEVSSKRYGRVSLQPTASPMSLIPDPSLWDETRIGRLLSEARREICLQFLSYSPVGRDSSPYVALDGALRRAAGRGVRVRLLVADWQKGTPAERALKDLAAVPNIEVRFSVIPEWSGGYIPYARVEHCKFVLVDGGKFWLGTSNGEKSYFHDSRNLGLIVDSAPMAQRLRRVFYKSWDGGTAEAVDPARTYSPRRHGEE
ncbi:MAG: phospholipase D-like domain-containing protein [Candidatus Aminicenantes bacterium]|nr:phospholipase D-like domain-containing protein [Candidatus Aminicenantes bacterium]